MPLHDWTRVHACIFHDFHHAWISTIKRGLNQAILPQSHYALAEQPSHIPEDSPGGLALADVKPKVSFHAKTEMDIYATKANTIAIRHVSDDRVVAMIEIVSPGNKSTIGGFRHFVDKAVDLLRDGIHLLIIDPFPPGPRDPHGIHKAIWQELDACDFTLPADRLLTMVSYIGGASQEAFIEPTAVGGPLPDMPVFLNPDIYVSVPLEQTYQSAWAAVPQRWQKALVADAL